MPQPFEPVSPGQPFRPSAYEWNQLGETVRTVRDGRSIFRPGDLLPPDVENLTPIIITQVDGSGNPMAVGFRMGGGHLVNVTGRILTLTDMWACPGYGYNWHTETGTSVYVNICELPGYLVTGDVVMCYRTATDGYYYAVAGPTRNHFLAPVLSMSGTAGSINLLYYSGDNIVQPATNLMCCTPTAGTVATGDLVTGFYNDVVGRFFITHNLTNYCCGNNTTTTTTTTTGSTTTGTTTGSTTTGTTTGSTTTGTTTGSTTTGTTTGSTTTGTTTGSTTTGTTTGSTTTGTTTTGTTTTTLPPCGGTCGFISYGDGTWGFYSSNCSTYTGGCNCPPSPTGTAPAGTVMYYGCKR